MPTTTEASPEPSHDSPDPLPTPARAWWIRAAALALALAFLGGAVGYLVGTRSSATPSNAVDIGFLQDMADHHDQAITMALETYNRTQDPVIRGFAQDVLLFQRYELGQMDAYLADHRAARAGFDPQRTTMSWMGMGTPLESMTGMASREDMTALGHATGSDLDRTFLELMTAHHEGGVHMASYAALHAADPKVRALADRMAKFQATEINEYRQYRDGMNTTTTS